jgi:hypothetical protein
MIAYVILGIALLVGFLLVAQWFVSADTKSVVKAARWGAVVLAAALLVVLILTRAWQWLPALALAAIPWLTRFRAVSRMARNARGPSRGQQSTVDTAFVRMTLDHDSGDMDGEVLQGRFAGCFLSSLQLSDLLALLDDCQRHDERSAAVLAAYLDRCHPDWRDRAGESGASRGASSGGPMSVAEARQILGVSDDASEAEIKEAHRRLMKQFHPDQGGTSYLAAKINEAKETLLG